jgi:hypothetical protein
LPVNAQATRNVLIDNRARRRRRVIPGRQPPAGVDWRLEGPED